MNDLKFAFRQLLKNPGFTAVAVVRIALGIGANTAILTLINALVLRSLHVPEPERLVRVTAGGASLRDEGFPYAFYQRLSERAPSHTALAAAQRWVSKRDLRATGFGQIDPEPVKAQAVSGSFFHVLDVPAFVGRTLAPADDRTDDPQPVVVISHAFWQRRFGADPSVIGRAIQLDTMPFTIVGVMPAGFSGIEVDGHADLWWPVQLLTLASLGLYGALSFGARGGSACAWRWVRACAMCSRSSCGRDSCWHRSAACSVSPVRSRSRGSSQACCC